jgi:hypothetical protein
MKTIENRSIVRMNNSLDSKFGIGIVRYHLGASDQVKPVWKIEFQNGKTYYATSDELRVLSTYDECFTHCQSIMDCAINPINDPNCGLQNNYCCDDDCDCSICPFNNHNTMKHPTCIEDGHREAWFYETDPSLVEKTKVIINFLMAN